MTGRFESYVARPAKAIGGELRVPGDKSISHRALMLGAIAQGQTRIEGMLQSDDCLATLAALRALGVTIEEEEGATFVVHGAGARGLRSPTAALDLGNSGTAMRLLAGLLAGQGVEAILTGDASLVTRPMGRIAEPLGLMGARVETCDGKPPISIHPCAELRGIDYSLPMVSAQVKSAILLAGISAQGTTIVRSPGISRDHTERMLRGMGVDVESDDSGRVVSLRGPAPLRGIDVEVPGDFSSAAFFIVAGCIGAPEGILIRNVGVNPTRTGLLEILQAMGGQIEIRNLRTEHREPVADIWATQSELVGIDVPPELVPLAIDEFPALFVAAAVANGCTRVAGAEELRFKESDRIAVAARALDMLGIAVSEAADGIVIEGGSLRGGRVDAAGDHRIAMSMAVASLASAEPVEILNTAQVATSFPGFVDTARRVGFDVRVREGAAA